jgi:uncharacterized protein with FMN-binding domain
MRRAVYATAGTVVALVALLDYKSSGAIHTSNLAVGTSSGATPPTSAAPTTAPTTAAPATSPTTGGTTGSAATPPTTTAPTTTAPTSRSYTGTNVSYAYGTIEVQIDKRSGRITSIRIPQESATDPRSQYINSQAVPILTSEALKAQSLNFDVVSGATYTSDAFAQSFQAALDKAKG